MDNKVPAEKLIALWIGEIGGRCPVDRRERIPAYLDLLKKFVACGYAEDDITPTVDSKVMNRSYIVDYHDTKKRKKWKKMASEDWETAKAMTWPPEEIPEGAPTPALVSTYQAVDSYRGPTELPPIKIMDKSKIQDPNDMAPIDDPNFLSDLGIADE